MLQGLYKKGRLLVRDAFDSPKPILNRLFHYISTEEMDDYQSTFPANTFKYIPGTLKIHEVVTSSGEKTHIRFWNISCACVNCLNNYATCKRKEVFKDVVDMITLQKHVFTSVGKRKQKQNNDDIDLNEDEISELENAETEAIQIDSGRGYCCDKNGRRPPLLPPEVNKIRMKLRLLQQMVTVMSFLHSTALLKVISSRDT